MPTIRRCECEEEMPYYLCVRFVWDFVGIWAGNFCVLWIRGANSEEGPGGTVLPLTFALVWRRAPRCAQIARETWVLSMGLVGSCGYFWRLLEAFVGYKHIQTILLEMTLMINCMEVTGLDQHPLLKFWAVQNWASSSRSPGLAPHLGPLEQTSANLKEMIRVKQQPRPSAPAYLGCDIFVFLINICQCFGDSWTIVAPLSVTCWKLRAMIQVIDSHCHSHKSWPPRLDGLNMSHSAATESPAW